MAQRKHTERTIRTTVLRRIAYWERDSVDMQARTVELAFSSEQPVNRWFGDEILDHSKGSVRMDRLRDTGPLLLHHDSREHIGTVESAKINTKDRIGRAVVRIGNGVDRDAILQDIADGIRKCVSVGYRIHRMKLEESSDDEADTYRATDWEPYEISLVSMPADASVGVGREAREWHSGEGDDHDTIIVDLPHKETKNMNDNSPEKLSRSKRRKAREATEAERTRILWIERGGEKYGQKKLATSFIESGKSLQEFNLELLDTLPGAQKLPKLISPETFEYGMPANRGEVRPSGWQTPDGRAVPVLRSDESVTKRLFQSGIIPTEQQGLDVGDAIRAMITGIWPADGALHRALAGGTDASGGWWLTPVLSGQIIDLARAKSVLMDAGAQTVLMSSSELAVVRITADPAIGFVAENQVIPEVEPTFGRLTFRARKIAARIKISKELVMDAPNAAEQIRTQLAAVLGVSLDLAALVGDADGEEIVGIFNHDDVQEMAAIGGPTFDDLIDAIQLVEDQNGVSGAYILPPAVKNTLAKLKDSQGNYLQPPVDVTALKRFVTKQLADSQACVGDFTQVWFGVREAVQVEVSTEGADTWERDQVEIRIKWRGDVQLAQPNHLVRLTGIT